ncbi:hypothetical protein [Peribacillus kribbensis]|uniref:hypothetical protein n=1 Tax=Peribacillus kribbensis TaxID=356658 RepID=UPI000419FD30|nr:hypothetical protein [Peribacillus kribbensis]
MYRKNCYRCGRPSFSSVEHGSWICPVCGNDLSGQKLFNAATYEKLHSWKSGMRKSEELFRITSTKSE